MKLNLNTRFFLVLLAAICFCQNVAADKIKELQGTSTLVVEEKSNMTFAEAWNDVINAARIDAMKAEYGENISEDIIMVQKDGKQYLDKVTHSITKGQWIEDTQEPIVTVTYNPETHFFIYNAQVRFKSRKKKTDNVHVEWKVLRGGTADDCESDHFNDKDRIYFSLQAASKGYCAVYLIGVDDEVNCLVPYKDNVDGYHEVQANVRNVFADSNHQPYRTRTDYDIENDYICLIYSPNKFTKCVGERGDYNHPEKVDVAKFNKWLAELRTVDADLQDKLIPIRISNPSPTKER